MPMVDSHGRVFGRWNLVDAVLVLLVLVLIPLAYGAYVLFRTPAPRLTAVEPGSLIAGNNLRVLVRGENLRPYMRVSFGDVQGNSFVFRNTSEALVDLNPMPAGEYDVVLFDESQERSRLPKAFTLLAPPLPASEVMLIGTFGNLTADRAAGLTQGMTIENVGQIVTIAPPLPETTRVFAGPVLEIPIANAVRVPVVLRVACAVKAPEGVPQCTVGDARLAPTSMLLLKTPIGPIPFQVDQIRGLQPVEPVQVTVQVIAREEIVDQIRVGDADYGQFMNPLAAGAVVDRVGNRIRVGEGTDRVDVSLTAQAQRGSSSWTYAAAPLRAGAPLRLRTPRYEADAVVLRVSPEWTTPQAADTPSTGASRRE
jgi:hypothetical protein